MQNRIIFIFVAICALIFVISFDRWGQNAFVQIVLKSFAPTGDEVKLQYLLIKPDPDLDFPANFLIGASSSAYQIEGGWNESGRTPSIWDDFIHFQPLSVDDNTTADIGCDSFHYYKEDIKALKLVGFQHYRFSISWTRIVPTMSVINQQGIDYYAKLIDTLIGNNIEPIVTLFHWDVPRWLQDLGGLTNPLFVEHFKFFADVLFENFGPKVKTWITMNEPFNFCTQGYGTSAVWAPAIHSPGVGEYLCGHYMIIAHAAVYHLYREKYFKSQRGSVGITLDSRFYYSNSSLSKEELHRAQDYRLGWFAHPIFSETGGYPEVMTNEIEEVCKLEGRAFSRLPRMDDKTKLLVKGSSDFLGLNYYTSRILEVDKTKRSFRDPPAWFKDSKSVMKVDPSWKRGQSEWLYSVPQGLRDLLNWIKDEYNNPPVFITENGWSDNGEIEDQDRIEYFRSHLIATSKALNEDGCNVIGYTAWSLLDSFEWNRGFLEKFGLFNVNFSSPTRERTPKKSTTFFKELIRSRIIP